MPTPPAAPRSGPDRFLLAIVGGVILLILVSVVLVLTTRSPRPAPPADPASVVGVVQGYVEATRAGDGEKARSFLSRDARAQAEARNRQNPNTYSPAFDDNVRIIVEATTQTDTTAEAKVTISRFYGRSDPFSSGVSHRTVTVKLIREDGQWRITQPTEPYQFN